MLTYSHIFNSLAVGLIQHPEKLLIHEEQITSSFQLLRVDCAPSDYSQIIGKGARHIKAFQHLLGIIAAKRNEKVDLSVRGPHQKIDSESQPKRAASACINEKIVTLLSTLLTEATDESFKLNAFNRDLVSYVIILTKTSLDPDLLESLQSLLQAIAKVAGRTLRLENDLI